MDIESRRNIAEICDAIKKKVDRAYVFECAKKRERPEKLWRLWIETGLLAIGLPEEYGGVGGSVAEQVLALDLLHQAGLGLGNTVPNAMSRVPILKHGTPEQRQRYLPPTANGTELFAFCITEPDSGTNTFKIRSTAKARSDGNYVLNGQKCYITAFDEAAHALVVVRTSPPDKANRTSGLSLFIVDTKSKGISSTMMDIAVYMTGKNWIVNFDDVVVPRENILGEEGRGIECLFDCLNPERLLVGGMNLGQADHVLNRGVEYAKMRSPFNAPIGSYQSIQHPMAIAKSNIEAARCMLYDTADRYDRGEKIGVEVNMVKYLASVAFKQAAEITATAFGGSFADLATDIIPHFLKAKLQETAPVNNNIVLSMIAQQALGLPKSY